jgi:hypothetical protein
MCIFWNIYVGTVCPIDVGPVPVPLRRYPVQVCQHSAGDGSDVLNELMFIR